MNRRSAFVRPENETLVQDVLLLLHGIRGVEGGREGTVHLRDKKQVAVFTSSSHRKTELKHLVVVFYLSAGFGRRLGMLASGGAGFFTVYHVQSERFTHFLHGRPVLKSKEIKIR